MENLYTEPNRGNSYSTTILIAIVLLIVLYFLAKGCTNRDDNTNKNPETKTESKH